ncbi:hypothetical protein LWI29_032713 [Acer saccharum]|uniref:Uncharacterized protein n=1 Tax=Acer saccharum TaxID=4024 RepID=A0AA39SZ33_ACESA|nr:hypothetical protein LWI29_032713 [Acer saccharum]KAK1583064.1 hypothetical protein Q3G72_020690 [Acer saccharum]
MTSHKKLSTAANLSNLLPTGTILAFEALVPAFSHNGDCLPANKYLTLSIIVGFSLVCFFSSFTDTIKFKGRVYYGIATLSSIFVFNQEDTDDDEEEKGGAQKKEGDDDEEKGSAQKKEGSCCTSKKDSDPKIPHKVRKKYKIRLIDFVHALSSLLVFLVFAISNSDVQRCFFPRPTANGTVLMMNLPLAVWTGVSFLFMLFPTKRRGIGFEKTVKTDTTEPKKPDTVDRGVQTSVI